MKRAFLVFLLLVVALGAFAWLRFLRFTTVPEPTLTGRLSVEALEWEGRQRSFLRYVPASLAERPALVLVLHGSLGDGARARASFAYEFDRLADEHGFVVAYPDGYERHWNGCRKAGPYEANRLGIDDVGFLGALVAELAREHGVDPARVFVTGVSNGGHMALRLAFEAPDLVRAVAPVVAAHPSRDNMGCRPRGKPVSLLVMNGTADPMNPWEGGTAALYGLVGSRGDVLSTEDSVRYWAELAGHAERPAVTELPDRDPGDESTVERRRWRAPGRPDVVLYAIRGGGHTVPHPSQRMPRLLGPTNGDIVAAREIWDFFAAAP